MSHAAATAAPRHGENDVHELRALGFWIYLMTDALIFALLFATYGVMVGNTAGGPNGRALFDLNHVAYETALLLLSSITFGFASLSARGGGAAASRGGTLFWLAVTFLLGAGFVVLEIREFAGMIGAGAGPDRSGFLSAFFTLVGTHGLHVSMGLLWIVILSIQVVIKGLTLPVASRLHRLALFWHFLDIAWIGIFSVVYLPGLI